MNLTSSKRECVKSLSAHALGATLHDDSTQHTYAVSLEAPAGHHWEGSVHCRAANAWYASGNKSEYWAEVLSEIKDLEPAIVCDSPDCEGIKTHGDCEYWNDS